MLFKKILQNDKFSSIKFVHNDPPSIPMVWTSIYAFLTPKSAYPVYDMNVFKVVSFAQWSVMVVFSQNSNSKKEIFEIISGQFQRFSILCCEAYFYFWYFQDLLEIKYAEKVHCAESLKIINIHFWPFPDHCALATFWSK